MMGINERTVSVKQEALDVSILMPVYNTVAYLAEAIESVLIQGWWAQKAGAAWELLIVDDGSTDGSLQIAQQYANRHPRRIRVLRHKGGLNRGISASRNLGLHSARGAMLAFLDSDDVWLPHHIETLTAAMKSHPDVAMVYGSAERWVDFALPFDEASARDSNWGANYLPPLLPPDVRAGVLAQGSPLRWFQADESFVPCICSAMVRTAAARTVGGFCNAFRGLYDDQAFHAKISLRFSVYAIDVCVARYRQHQASCCSHARKQPSVQTREQQRFLRFLDLECDTLQNAVSQTVFE